MALCRQTLNFSPSTFYLGENSLSTKRIQSGNEHAKREKKTTTVRSAKRMKQTNRRKIYAKYNLRAVAFGIAFWWRNEICEI